MAFDFDFDFGLVFSLAFAFVRELAVVFAVFFIVLDDGGGEGEDEAEVDPGEALRLLKDEGGAPWDVEGVDVPAEVGGSDFDLEGRGGICVGVVVLATGAAVELLL